MFVGSPSGDKIDQSAKYYRLTTAQQTINDLDVSALGYVTLALYCAGRYTARIEGGLEQAMRQGHGSCPSPK